MIRFVTGGSVIALGLALASSPAWAQDKGQVSALSSDTTSPVQGPQLPAAGSQPAQTQASDRGIGEIVVTAQRRSESLQRVPASVEVVSGAQLQAAHINNLANLQELSPSLIVTQTSNPSAGVFTIRGVGTAVTDLGFEQSVGVYIDGVYRGRPGAALQDLLDIDRVEVLRGPQSTLFGRNNAAGAINITTVLPNTAKFGMYGEATYGNYSAVQAKMSVNVPIVTDHLAIRLSVAENKRNGFIDAPNLPRGDVNAEDRQSFRAQVYWTPTPSTRVRIIGDYSQLHDRCCSYVTRFVANSDASLPFSPLAPVHGPLYGYTPPSVGTAGVSPDDATVAGTNYNSFARVSTQNGPTKENSHDKGISGQVDQDIGNELTLTAIGSARRFKSDIDLDIDGTNSALESIQSQPDSKITEQTAEVRLQNKSGGPIEFVVGGYYFHQKIDALNTLGVELIPFGFTFLDLSNTSVQTTSSGAVFGQATYNLTNTIRVTGGLRYLNESKHEDATAVPGTATFGGTARSHNGALMGSATVAWQPVTAANIYARYARGYKSAAINSGFTAPVSEVSPVVKPETTDAYEVGAKLKLFGNTLTANLAAYTQTVKDLQVQSFDSSTGEFETRNAAKVRSRGVEADLLYRPVKQITFSGGISYLDAKYLSFPGAPPVAGLATLQDLSGRMPANAPHWTLIGGVNFTQPINDAVTFVANGTIRHATGYYTDVPDSEAFKNGRTNFVDASIELQLRNGFGVQFWGRNLTKQNAYLSGIGIPGTASSLAAFVNDPRTYGVTLRFRH